MFESMMAVEERCNSDNFVAVQDSLVKLGVADNDMQEHICLGHRIVQALVVVATVPEDWEGMYLAAGHFQVVANS